MKPFTEITIPLKSNDEAIQVLGPYDRNAKLLRQAFDIEVFTRSGNLRVKGSEEHVAEVQKRIEHLLGKLRKGRLMDPLGIEEILVGAPEEEKPSSTPAQRRQASVHSISANERRAGATLRSDKRMGKRLKSVEPRGANQRRYMDVMAENNLCFGIGPAGTGKTFLAVAAAVSSLREGQVRRLIITRPVVEAGENLGFLPGDLQAKLDPYMRPVYDSLYALIGFEETRELEEAGIIEIAPLAYMRGRTLADSFVLLDEAQNTTVLQMKMFLTRLGEGSRMVATGDPFQSDIPTSQKSGLMDAVKRLRGFEGIGVCEFEARDIVRHPLVEKIVRAYDGPGAH
jgi:phosphate starvation-inducible PhoH-like protein